VRGGLWEPLNFGRDSVMQTGEKTGKRRPTPEAGPMDDMQAKDVTRIAPGVSFGKPHFRVVR